jgi:thiosulfate dehydrogenase [quinone] large subunit
MSNQRKLAGGLGGAATVLLLLLLWPVFIEGDPLLSGDIRTIATWAFWILAIALVVVLFQERKSAGADQVEIEGPAFARFLFGNRQAGLLWLPIRLFLGISWLEAGYHKLTDPAWTGGGEALKGYWEGRPLISFEWYRDFLNLLLSMDASPWFAWIITLGEMAVGVGLILGLLTGVAAFFGVTMNMSFLLAGSASTNPVMAMLAIGVILAWKVAGYYGLDRWVLPILGTPWKPGQQASQPSAPVSQPMTS